MTRRRLLAASAATALGGVALTSSARTSDLPRPVPAAAAGRRPPRRPGELPAPERSGIDHVVVVMMENRSFDHFLGWVPGADGRQTGPTFVDRQGLRHRTWHLEDFRGAGHPDPDHSSAGGLIALAGGTCDGWLLAGANDSFAIGYYDGADLDFWRQTARNWTVCDRYFSATMGPTYPNRLYQHAGRTDRLSNTGATCTLPTIWDRLAAAGLSGRYYYGDFSFLSLWGQRYLPISAPFPQFLTDCGNGSLPEVAFVDPRYNDEGGAWADDHPHADVRAGEAFLAQVYNAVVSGPAWERTMLVVNYDEWGGFFDHVPPPVAPDDDPATALRGFRVPAAVISPRSPRGGVAHGVYDHTSILRTIEWRWDLPPLGTRDGAARNLAEVLDFTAPPRPRAPLCTVRPVPSEQEVSTAGRQPA